MISSLLAITFVHQPRLWLLLAVAALGLVYVATQFRRRTYAVRFTNLALLDSVAPKRPGWRRHLPAVAMLAALAGLVGAYAEPATEARVPRERATIVLAIDTSLSMEATDVEPSRLVAAQDAAKSFLDLIPDRLNVGLVTFNGAAQIRVPPTTDREAVRAAIDQLRLGERTAIGEAIYASLEAIKTAPGAAEGEDPVPARIVLMSDGETTSGRPDAEAAAQAKKDGVPISTISFGTASGTITLPGTDGAISVAVNPEALARIANDTDGTAFEAATEEELRAVYADIGSSVGYTTEPKLLTEQFVAGSLLALFVAAVLSQLWFSRLP